MKYELPKLPYDYSALEPYIDAKTMEIHHTKHHQAYIDKLNAVLDKYPELADQSVEDLLENYEALAMDEADKLTLLNNGGGHVNHSLFWQIMGPKKESTFGSVEDFKKKFEEAAKTRFGSGWAWLVRNGDGKLQVYSTPNQDSPLIQDHKPIIGLDVWEHAYYLKYQNKRPDYIEAWWTVLKFI
jgi:Fe-Mn family superoxide dismutase